MTDCAIFMLDTDGLVTSWNAGAEQMKGYRAEEILGRHFSRFYTAEDQAAGIAQNTLSVTLRKGKYEAQGWRVRRDGSLFWASAVIEAIHDDAGALIGFAEITRDLTERKLQDDRLDEIRRVLYLALSNISQGLCLFGPDDRLLLCNDGFRAMYRVPEDTVPIGTRYEDVLAHVFETPDRTDDEAAALIRLVRERHEAARAGPERCLTFEMAVGGRVLSVRHRTLPDGGWVSTTDDITERQQSELHVRHLAHHDPLTGLLNRAAFRGVLDRIYAAGPVVAPAALLYIDLDHFKPINDTWGHATGDAVLDVVARRIAAQIRPTDSSSRLGGDEFTVLLVGCTGRPEACLTAERLIGAIARPISVQGVDVTVGASVGVALAPGDGADPDTLLRNADLALAHAKQAGKNRARCYDGAMASRLERHAAMERDLKGALRRGALTLDYRPVVDAATGGLIRVAASLRWTGATWTEIPSAGSLPLPEQVGLMAEIDDWTLATACSEAVSWPASVRLAVRLSAAWLGRSDLPSRIARVLAETGLAAGRLDVTITEAGLIAGTDAAANPLGPLREAGIGVRLADFGTGSASLGNLLSLPFSGFEAGRSLVHELGVRPEALTIVRAAVGICRTLGISMAAEGVETQEQLDILRAEGCSEVQGDIIAPPGSPDRLRRWFAPPTDGR